ncbi:hypothetical protein D1871_14190 [Nakamurella silvestris]|nr:hypothetical protein D1871_14190 [Nakamurella silvestris]
MTDELLSTLPVIAAPMAGGPSTPALVAEVGRAGGLGFLAAGYLTAEALGRQLVELEDMSESAYGVNLFLSSPDSADPAAIDAYADRLAPVAAELGVELGTRAWTDDALEAKIAVLAGHRPAYISLTFAAPSSELVAQLRRDTGARVIATVTSVDEARQAVASGVDLLCAQGMEAGGHRGIFQDDSSQPDGGQMVPVRDLIRQITAVTGTPVIAAGGLSTGADIAAVLATGAVAAQLGTAFLCTPEAGTSRTHRRALLDREGTRTVITRAFSGRPARALENAFVIEHSAEAPSGYPQIHHLTRPLRVAAAAQGRGDLLHLWAGTGWQHVTEETAFTLVRRLAAEAGL